MRNLGTKACVNLAELLRIRPVLSPLCLSNMARTSPSDENIPHDTLALLLAALACTSARAPACSPMVPSMTVVAERAKGAPAAQDGPVSCALVDGGYAGAGDPMAGQYPPSAASVRQELLDALGRQNLSVGAPSPAVLLTYYWGVLRVDHNALRLPMGINANQDARINLVSTAESRR